RGSLRPARAPPPRTRRGGGPAGGSAAAGGAVAGLRDGGRGGGESGDRTAAGRAPDRPLSALLQVDGQPALEELIVGSFHPPAPDQLEPALLGQEPDARREPPLLGGRVPGRSAAQRQRVADQDLCPYGQLALDVARIGEVGSVVEREVPVAVRPPGDRRHCGEREEGDLLGRDVLEHGGEGKVPAFGE